MPMKIHAVILLKHFSQGALLWDFDWANCPAHHTPAPLSAQTPRGPFESRDLIFVGVPFLAQLDHHDATDLVKIVERFLQTG